MSDSLSNTRLARFSARGSSSTTSRRYEGSGTAQMLPPSLIVAQGTDIFPSMGRGIRRYALKSAVAAARIAVAPRPDPRVATELARTLTARATASCAMALPIIPFTIIAYNAAYYPSQVTSGAFTAAVADLLIVLLLIGIRRRMFDNLPWLPFLLLAA